MKRIGLYMVFFILVVSSCEKEELNCNDDPVGKVFESGGEDYQVYIDVLKYFFKELDQHIVLKSETNYSNLSLFNPGSEMFLQNLDVTLDKTILGSFISVNDTAYVLEKEYFEIYSVNMASNQYLDNIFKSFGSHDGWDHFYQDYPGSVGYIEFSRIGFSEDGLQAILEMAHNCGSLCAMGSIIILEKERENWIVKEVVYTWVS